MSEERTAHIFRSNFRKSSKQYGGISAKNASKGLYKKEKKELSDEIKIKNEIQKLIIDLVGQRASIETIKQSLKDERYESYQQYFDGWIQDFVSKVDGKIKIIITNKVKCDKSFEEIIEGIEELNSEVYSTYKEQIDNKIKEEIRLRQLKKQNEKKQEEEER